MSILMMSQVWALENLESAEKLVLLAIADFADDHGQAWPSIPTLARKSSLSEDTVRRKIRKLSTDGIVSMSPRKDKTGRDTSYVFQLFPNTSPKFSISGEGSTVPPSQGASVQGSTMQGGGSDGATLFHETSIKHQKEPSKTFSDFFEILWKDYPSNDGKRKALVHFRSTVKNETDCERIRKALNNYLAMLKRETWRSPKNGDTWFNNWTDWENEHLTPSIPARSTAIQTGSTLEELRAKGIDI